MSAFSVTVIDKLIQPLKKTISMEDSSGDGEPPFSFYPPLYITPPVEPRRPSSPSPSSPSTSPYVVNFKRRGPTQSVPMQNHADEVDRFEDGLEFDQSAVNDDNMCVSPQLEAMEKVVGEGNDLSPSGDRVTMETCCDTLKTEIETETAEDDEFSIDDSNHLEAAIALRSTTNPQLSLTKVIPGHDCDRFTSPRTSTCEEFYDAPEAPIDDSTGDEESSSATLTFKSPGRLAEDLAPRLQEEIARRIRAEEAVKLLQQRWNEAAQKCASMGFSLTPNELTPDRSRDLHVFEHSVDSLVVARVVAGAVASAAIRAAKDEELEGIIASKNWEISRLWDKLQYVELINREMSQRNQQDIEVAQRGRRRHKRRQKWVIGGLCSALCLGTAGLLCYKYVPWNQVGTWSKASESSGQD